MVENNVWETLQNLDLVIPNHVSHLHAIVSGVTGVTSAIALLLVEVEFKLELEKSSHLLHMVENNVWEMLQNLDLVILNHVLHLHAIVFGVTGVISVIALLPVEVEFRPELEKS